MLPRFGKLIYRSINLKCSFQIWKHIHTIDYQIVNMYSFKGMIDSPFLVSEQIMVKTIAGAGEAVYMGREAYVRSEAYVGNEA